MTDNFSPPSMNTADLADIVGIIRLIKTKFLQGIDGMLPARVISYDRDTNLAQVQPLIVMVTTDNIRVQRGQIAAVQALQMGGGGFVLSFPIAAGDLGWIKANDRDISLFKQFYAASPPNTQRKHSFEDALFIPDTMLQGVTIADEDVDNLVLQNLDGTVKIALWGDFLKIIAPRVGIGGTPDDNAILDVQSTTQAFRPPTMSTGQKNAIPSPKIGFTVYDTGKPGLSSYDGGSWS